MNVRDFNVDVKFGNQANIIYCIYDAKPHAAKMINALLIPHADTRTTEVLYEGNGIITTQNKFIVGISKDVYFQLAQPVPAGKMRRVREEQKLGWQIVFADKHAAIEFEKQLAVMNITILKPELKQIDGTDIYKDGKWITEGVFLNNKEYIIRIDQAGKARLDASRECFQGFPSFQQLKGIEERCGLLLYHFAQQVIQLCAGIKSESLHVSSEILQQEWISNRKKIEIIDEKVSDRANSGLLGAIRGKDGQRFQKLYSAFQLKKKADNIIDNVHAISLNMDEFIAPYAQQIIHDNQQTINKMNEKIDQMAVEIRDLHTQNAWLGAMVQTQQVQNNQLSAVVQQLSVLLPPAVQVEKVNFHPNYGDLQPIYESAQSQVVNNVTMFTHDIKQRNQGNQAKQAETAFDDVNAHDAGHLFKHV